MDTQILGFPVPNWRYGGSTGFLRLYANVNWTDIDGIPHMAGTPGDSEGFFQEVSFAVSGTSAQIPAFFTPATVNSPDHPNVRLTGVLFDEDGMPHEELFTDWQVPAVETLTWVDWTIYNHAKPAPLGDCFVTREMLLAALTAIPETEPEFIPASDYNVVDDAEIVENASIGAADLKLLNAPGAAFTSQLSGRVCAIAGAGPGGATLITQITGVLSPTSLTVLDAAAGAIANTRMVHGTDNTTALQNALNAASLNTKTRIVRLSVGNYLFATGSLTIPQGVTLQGSWAYPPDQMGYRYAAEVKPMAGQGTTLVIVAGEGTAGRFIFVNSQAAVRGLSLFYPAQLPTRATPLVFPWTIEMFGSGPVVENLELVNSYQGIYSHIGQRHTVRNVKGQPLLFGLYASQLLDTSLFENINFVPIYMWSTTEGPPYTIHNLEQWRHKNGTAFKFGRVDNAVCSNLFTYMSFIGFKFVIDPAEGTSYAGGTGAPGGRAWVQFNSCGADTCAYPVDIDDVQGADATSAVGVDFSDGFFAAATWPGISFSPTPPLHAVYARGTFTGRLGLSNCRSNLAAKTIVCEGNGRINVDQFYFQAWTSNAVVVSAGDVSVTGSTFKQGSATPVILVTGSPWLTVAGNVIEYDDTGTTIFSISATANFSEAGNVDALGCKWETQAMGNSWVNYGAGYHDVAYRKQDGKVRFRGTIKNGTTGVLFTLPARYRPPGHAFFTLPNNNSFANVQVATDGQVQIATLNNNVSLSLDQIQYSIR